MKRLYVLTTLLVVMLSYSCKKEAKETTALPVATIDLAKKWNETVVKVAKDVSVKLNSTAFRKMLKHEVLLRFDGDANILISSMMKRLPKYLAYEKSQSALNRTESDDPLLSSFNFDILEEAANDFPQMQLAVQTDAENWNAVTFVPEVVYLTANYDESTHSFVNGFDANQNPITASTLEDPVDNYVVVSQNERTIQRDQDVVRIRSTECPVDEILLDEPYNPESIPEEVEPCDIGGGGGGTGGGGTGSGGSSSYNQYVGTGQDGVLPTLIDRQMGENTAAPSNGTFNRLSPVGSFNGVTVYRKDFKHEKMRFIRCDNINEIESWANGAPEIRMHVFEQNVLNPSENLQIFKEEFKPDKRKDIKDKWYDARGVTMHLWDYQGTGTKASFGYYEYDWVLIPNEALTQIGGIIVDILVITTSIDSSGLRLIYGNIRNSVVTGIRSLKQKNGMSEYIGKDDYSIFNDEEEFYHDTGETSFKTTPDL